MDNLINQLQEDIDTAMMRTYNRPTKILITSNFYNYLTYKSPYSVMFTQDDSPQGYKRSIFNIPLKIDNTIKKDYEIVYEEECEYIIVGDIEKLGTCLIYTCGKSRDWANKILDRMLNNPTEQDIKEVAKFTNIRVKEVPPEDCWWNGNLD